jgi:hypothetical protein
MSETTTTPSPKADYFKAAMKQVDDLTLFTKTAVAGPGAALNEVIRKLVVLEERVIRDVTIAAELMSPGQTQEQIHRTVLNRSEAFWKSETPENTEANVAAFTTYLTKLLMRLDGLFWGLHLMEATKGASAAWKTGSPLDPLDALFQKGATRRAEMKARDERAEKVGLSYIPTIPVPEKLPPINVCKAVNWFLSHRPAVKGRFIVSGANGGDATVAGTNWNDGELLRRVREMVGRKAVSYCPALPDYWAKPLRELIELLTVYVESPPGAALRQQQLWAWLSSLPKPADVPWTGSAAPVGGGATGVGIERRFNGMDIRIPNRSSKAEPFRAMLSYRGQLLEVREFRAPRAVGIAGAYPQIEEMVTPQLLHIFGIPSPSFPRVEGTPL